MIKELNISNFKSIQDTSFACKKINVFIGEPNSGKSNIIEALSLLSQGIINKEVSKQILRYNSIGDLFYDFSINKPIQVKTDLLSYKLEYVISHDGIPENQFTFSLRSDKKEEPISFKIGHDGKVLGYDAGIPSSFKYYQYKRLDNFNVSYMSYLATPFGENLPSLLLSNEDYRNWVSEFFETKGCSLTLRPAEDELNMSKIINNTIYSYPYQAIS